MRRQLALSIADQALMSAFNLVLNLVLITRATPDQFGHFVVLFSSLFVLLSVQNSVIITPLNYLIPGRKKDEQDRQLSLLTSANVVMSAGGLVVGLLICLIYSNGPLLTLAVCVAFGLGLIREYARNVFVVHDRLWGALKLDIAYVAVSSAASIGLSFVLEPVTAFMLGLAAGNAGSLLLFSPPMETRLGKMMEHARAYGAVWKDTRWALLGAVQTEAQNRGYVFFVEAWRGSAAIGTLQAGRVIMSPMQLIATAWNRVARPRMAAMMHLGDSASAVRLLWQGTFVISGLAVAYGLATIVMWWPLNTYVFGDKYEGMELTVALWWVHTMLLSLNGVVSTLLQARRQFRELAAMAFVTALLCVVGLGALTLSDLPTIAVLGVLIVAEAIDLGAMYWLALRRPAARAEPLAAE